MSAATSRLEVPKVDITMPTSQPKSVLITEMSAQDARLFLLDSSSYVNFDLPRYFNFDDLLAAVSQKIHRKSMSTYLAIRDQGAGKAIYRYPGDTHGVNYSLVANKDGEFAWRPFEIIHPVLYVKLVHALTTKKNWSILQARFKRFLKSNITCESIPRKSLTLDSSKAVQVSEWWASVEQKTIEYGLDYCYVFDIDLTDCYGSIYTHSLAWALHGKEYMKKYENRKKDTLLGNILDSHIRWMRHNQTNGIPQGSVLMDFVAEILLGYADEEITKRLKKIKERDYRILRYRDDFRIMTNDPELGKSIIREITLALAELGLKLNTSKTRQNNDVIIGSVKPEKILDLRTPSNPTSVSKWLLRVYDLAIMYPNSGIVTRHLQKIYLYLEKDKKDRHDLHVLISITVNLALKNPRTYPVTMAILSLLIKRLPDSKSKVDVILKIRKKFERIPNTGSLDIWLQRVSLKVDSSIEYSEKMTKYMTLEGQNTGNLIWDVSWLIPELADLLDTPIINWDIYHTMDDWISIEEFALFKPNVPS